eukprot:m.219395 g.219395  ORF g.219395 m.219395 type:complete len:147 (-) comp13823_c1_seq3:739-1179(-)
MMHIILCLYERFDVWFSFLSLLCSSIDTQVCANPCFISTDLFFDDSHCPQNRLQLINNDSLVAKSQNALEQVVARGGNPLVVAQEGFSPKAGDSKKLKYLHVPSVVDCLQVVVTVVPLQLISYHIATLKGHDVDCPRNLAKSVTVE